MEKKKEPAANEDVTQRFRSPAYEDVTQRFRSPVEDSFYESFVIRSRSNVGTLYAANLSSSQRHVQQVKYIEREKYQQLSRMEKGQREMLKKMEKLKTAQEISRRKSLGALPQREYTPLMRNDEILPPLQRKESARGVSTAHTDIGKNARKTMGKKNNDLQCVNWRSTRSKSIDAAFRLQPEKELKNEIKRCQRGKESKELFKPLRRCSLMNPNYSAGEEITLKREKNNQSENRKLSDAEEPKNEQTFPSESGTSHVRFWPRLPLEDNVQDTHNERLPSCQEGDWHRRSLSSLSVGQRSKNATQPQKIVSRGRSMSLGSKKDWEQIIQKTSQLKSDTRFSMNDINLTTKTKYIPHTFRTRSAQDATL